MKFELWSEFLQWLKMQHILLNLLKEKISWHIYLTVSSFFGWNEVARKWRTWLRAVDTHYPDPMTTTKVYQACVQNVDILLPRVSDCRKEFQTGRLLSSNPYPLRLPCVLSSNCLSPQLYVNKWIGTAQEVNMRDATPYIVLSINTMVC